MTGRFRRGLVPLPGRRQDDAWANEHVRARTLAAERLLGPLAETDAAWLDAHLEACRSCRAVATAYAEQQTLLRSTRTPEPPRDLWARTAAALDREPAVRVAARRDRLPRRPPSTALSGVVAAGLVLVVVVGAALLTDRGPVPILTPGPTTAAASGSASTLVADASPIAVRSEVGFVQRAPDGTLRLSYATVERVCATAAGPDCPPVTDRSSSGISLAANARSVVQSPNGGQIAVVVDPATTPGGVYVVSTSPAPSASPSPPPASASPTVGPSAPASATPSPPVAPSASASPSSPAPSASVSPSPSPSASAAPAESPSPSAPSSATPSSPASPSASPVVGATAIVEGVVVVGQSPTYSPSGRWLAFTARPADGSQGPDVYVWRVGDASARPITSDHRSVFSTWIGDQILGSRADSVAEPSGGATGASSASPDASASTPAPTASPRPSPSASAAGLVPASAAPDALLAEPARASGKMPPGSEARPTTFLIDPGTGVERAIPGPGIWRPVVDPAGRFVVYWQGTVAVDESGVEWRPASGQLVVARWDPDRLAQAADASPSPPVDQATSPSPSPSAAASVPAEPKITPSASAVPDAGVIAILASAPIRDWDAEWDDVGSRLGIWIADAVDPQLGRLSLHTIDAASGALDVAGPLLSDRPALAGFSIGDGRLAWVTPEGGTASKIEVLAWRGPDAGTAESAPQPDDTIVIR